MKKIKLVLAFSFLCIICFSQNDKTQNQQTGNQIDWNGKCYLVTQDFWNDTQKEIIKSTGIEKFKEIQKYSANENIPVVLLQWDGKAKLALDEYFKRLSSLKASILVECSHTWNEQKIKYAIVSVPFQELSWDKNAKWDTIYFIVKLNPVNSDHRTSSINNKANVD